MDHIFFDIRLSTKDPAKGEILEFAAIRTSVKGVPYGGAAFSSKILPTKAVDESAYRHYSAHEWEENGVPLNAAFTQFRKTLVNGYAEKFVLVVHIAQRLTPECREFFNGRRVVDISQIAWPLAFNSIIADCSLDVLATYYDVPRETSTAEGIVVSIARIYWEMMRRYKTALTGEKTISDFTKGMPAFEFVRRLVNM